MELIKKWLAMLSGKPVAKKPDNQSSSQFDLQQNVQKQSENPEKSTIIPQTDEHQSETDFYIAGENHSEDSVVEDFKAVEKLAKNVIAKVKTAPIPRPEISKKAFGVDSEPVSAAKTVTNSGGSPKLSNQMLGKIIRVIVIIVLVLILVFVLLSLYRLISQRGQNPAGQNSGASQTSPSPTPVTYQSYEPSIYANDPEILQLEEDISVLDAEMFRANIGNPMIPPPNLDFNISF